MAKIINVFGYKAFKKAVENFQKKDLVYCYFTGNKGEDGKSWSDKCASAEQYVLSALENYAKKEAIFIYTQVGDKKEWKDLNNPFRRDCEIHLTTIPTIMRWKHQWRLESTFCSKDDILKMLFSEHAD